jgi:hypothetical protein
MSDGFLNDLGLDNVEADPNYISDGTYPAFVFSADVRTKKDKSKSWVLTYKIAPESPKHAGQQQQEWFDLEPKGENAEMKKSFLKRRVLSLGVPEDKINSLQPNDVVGIKVAMSIVHRNGYQNVGTVTVDDGVTPLGATPGGVVTPEAARNLM